MRNKSQQIRAAKRKGVKATKRRAKVEARKKAVSSLPSVKIRTPQGIKRFFLRKPKEEGAKMQKVESPPRTLPPYRITRMQAHVEKLERGIRATDPSDPKRAKMVEKLNHIKRQLGK